MLRRVGSHSLTSAGVRASALYISQQKASLSVRGPARGGGPRSAGHVDFYDDSGDVPSFSSPLFHCSQAQAEHAALREEYDRLFNSDNSAETTIEDDTTPQSYAFSDLVSDHLYHGPRGASASTALRYGYSARYPTNARLVCNGHSLSSSGLGFLRPSARLLHRGLSASELLRAKEIAASEQISFDEAKAVVKREKAFSQPAVGKLIKKRVDTHEYEKNARGRVPADYVTKVKSDVVDDIIKKMTAPKIRRSIRRKREVPKEIINEGKIRSYVTSQLARDRLRSHFRIDPNTPIDHLTLPELYEYLFVALKGGEVQKRARRRIPMSMRMACGERSLEVPPPSFIYVLLLHDPDLLHESYHPRIAFAVEQWLKLPEATRKYFVDHPLKGISE